MSGWSACRLYDQHGAKVMSSSEGSVGDVEVAQGSQVSREGGLAIQVAVVLHGKA